MPNILLTGSSGFIGKNLKDFTEISRVVARTKVNDKECYIIKSIDADTNWDGAFNNIDCVIHLAGLAHSNSFTDDDYQNVNTLGTLRLAREAVKAGVKRFVFISSIGVNGLSTDDKPFCSTDKTYPHNAYALSKLNAEQGLFQIAKDTGLEVVVVRPTLVYGLHAPGNFGLLTRIVDKLPMLPFGLVRNKRSFISVQNLTDLLLTCAKHPNAAGHTFLASDGKPVSTKEFTCAIAKGLNKSIYQLPVPTSIMRFGAKMIGKPLMAEQLLGNLDVDSSNAFDVMGWKPPYTMEESMNLLSKEIK
ncbi:NAD-dependent epimerase/dehydratase family protein [Photobacterium leiognathi]|uniref:NAD-dependent epimerase/dehydratase family protein n=1 Tax=Photobacterium leiognathi TaxID=553611 RepID=UPI002981A2E3|nr:NAD-dependent epimerase/dehydratase family protein [Photobacterium leiognathi]